MSHFLRSGALASTLFLAFGCTAEPPTAAEAIAGSESSALTTTDVDVAPECQGILDYVNTVPVTNLRAYLPDTLADAIVARRAQTPFLSLMDLSSLNGVAQGRLAQIAGGARTLDFIDEDCAGVWEELAVSHEDMVAILAFANGATQAQLLDALPANHNAVPGLVAHRPFASLDALVAVKEIGPAALRYLRNAATHQGPLDKLASDVTEAHRDVDIRLAFNWQQLLLGQDQPGQLQHAECFGVDPSIVAAIGGTVRPDLATPAEVHADVFDAYTYANRAVDLGLDPAPGLADLDARVAGHSLSGCILHYAPDPWSGVNRAFFFDPATGFQILTDVRWSE